MQLSYQEFLPSPALSKYLAGHWKFVVPPDWNGPLEHLAPPDGCVSLFLYKNEPQRGQFIGLVGTRLSLFQTSLLPGSVYWGIRFLPGTFSCFFEQPLDTLRDQVLPAPASERFSAFLAVLNADFEDVHGLEHNLLQLKRKEPDEEVAKVVREILSSEGQCKIANLVQRAFVSERQLQKRFRKEVGLSMKELARVLRMRAALAQLVLSEHKHLDISFNSGYYDQAHFLHEFQAFARRKPNQLKQYLRKIQHGDIHW